jgi:transcriptional regulator with XRE-family HTH domain
LKEVGPAELRRRTGLDLRTIRKIRRGDTVPYRDTAERMARGLGTDVDSIEWPAGYLPIDHPGTIAARKEAKA